MADQNCISPCAGCAFTEGSEANLEPQNNIKAQFCLLGGIPFYCHHARDGSIQSLQTVTPAERRERIQTGLMIVCQGWRREVGKLAAEGYYTKAPAAKRAYAMLGLGALQIFLSEEEGEKKERAAQTLQDVILALNKERGFTEVVK